jgi:1-acyl-sn-glycerol-3-phosphate acyltransferase/nucleoside-diphosphate-sugar epimerase
MTRVAVIGGSDPVTVRLAAEVGASPGAEDCVAIGDPAERVGELLGKLEIDAAVYAAAQRGPGAPLPDLGDANEIFQHFAACGLRKVILVSSAAVHEPSCSHPGLISEARTSPRTPGNSLARGWRELEALAQAWRADRAALELIVLRPAAVVSPGGRDYFSRLLSGGLAVTLAGHDPSLQLLSVEDLARAVRQAVDKGREGTFHVAPRGVIPLRKALRLAGRQRLPLPHWLHWLGRKILAPLGLAAPIEQLQYLRYSWTVSGEKMRTELGFEPRRSSAQTIAGLHSDSAAAGDATPGPCYDDFGMDPDYIAAFGRTLFRFLHDVYWRIEISGLENVPRQGRVVLTGIHRGFMPWDGVMAMHGVVRGLGRITRYLIHPTLVKFPFLFNYMTKIGGVLACRENADWVLQRDGLLGVFPEGVQGAFSYYRDAYRLGKNWRDDFVRFALRHEAPIVPFVTVGSAEIFPILAKLNWRWWKRLSLWPCLPITATFPLLPIPLPTKWHTRYLEPVQLADRYPPEAADC